MLKSYRKNILREMKGNLSRMVSLFGIAALGVMMLTGLMCIAPDMRSAGQEYYVQQNVFDLRVLSTLGLTEQDIAAIAAVDGVEAVQPVKYQDVEAQWQGREDTIVVRLQQLPADPQVDTPENMDRLVLRSGRMPQADDECVVHVMGYEDPVELGTVLTLPEDTENVRKKQYTVVGTVQDPQHISTDRESSTAGSGQLNAIVFLPEGSLTTDYYTYLKDHQKISTYSVPFVWLKGMLAEMFPDDDNTDGLAGKANGTVDQFCPTKKQNSIVDMIRKNITCSVDKKTDVITITVQDQDKLICATMADTARVKLQDFIIEYRTRKAKTDLDYYTKLTNEAKKEYEDARKKYSDFADSNTNLSLASYKSKEEDLENDMQIKYNTYTTMNTQMQMAKAKVQERTPAFTYCRARRCHISLPGPKECCLYLQ